MPATPKMLNQMLSVENPHPSEKQIDQENPFSSHIQQQEKAIITTAAAPARIFKSFKKPSADPKSSMTRKY
jgi:hypothetical protein